MNKKQVCLVVSSLSLLLWACAPLGTTLPTVTSFPTQTTIPTWIPTSVATATPIPTSTTGEIRGRVIDSNDSLPIPGANISTAPPTGSTTADSGGNYSIAAVPPGNYTVVASKAGYTTSGVKIAVRAGRTTTADVHLSAEKEVFQETPEIVQILAYNLRETIPIPAKTKVLAVGDMDGDKVLDVVISNPDTQTISILERTGDTFTARFTISEPGKLRGPAVADIDSDGLPEILSGNFNGRVQIWEASGNDEYVLKHTEIVGNFIESSVAGDFDGDGQKEFLVARESFPSKIFILKSIDGSYQNQGSLDGEGGNCGIAGTFDLDGDGAPETVFHDDDYTSDKRKRLYVYEERILIFQDNQQSSSSLGDTDGNGLGEIIGRENSTGNLRILESTGENNSFVEVFNASTDGYSFRVLDVENDGRAEFWRTTDGGFGNMNVLWLATRTETTITPIYTSGSLFQDFPGDIKDVLAIGDTDYDGRPEIAVIQGEQLHILE